VCKADRNLDAIRVLLLYFDIYAFVVLSSSKVIYLPIVGPYTTIKYTILLLNILLIIENTTPRNSEYILMKLCTIIGP
jgi:hypothetical protein